MFIVFVWDYIGNESYERVWYVKSEKGDEYEGEECFGVEDEVNYEVGNDGED